MYTMSFVRIGEACPLGTMELNSLNFTVKRILFEIFRTNSNDKIQNCQQYFNFPDISVLLTARKKKFITMYSVSDNCLCALFKSTALTTDSISMVQYAQCTCKLFISLCIFFPVSFCSCTIIVCDCLPCIGE